MTRTTTLLAVALTLFVGCGDSDPAPKPATASTVRPVAELIHNVADDMRDIAALTYGKCANEAPLRRAMVRLARDDRLVPFDVVKVHVLTRRLLAQGRATLADCP